MRHETVSPVAEILLRGRERVNRGWVPWMPYGKNEDCALTAVTPWWGSTTDYIMVLRFLEKAMGISKNQIPQWNDTPGRTRAEVLAAYDRAIELALEENGA